jgi:hypothetical protein
MHLKNCPVYFVKDGQRQAVYYTVDARQLTEDGWTIEQEEEQTLEPAAVEAPKAPEVVTEEDLLDEMTRAELIDFAEANGIEFKSSASKADILEACKEFADG